MASRFAAFAARGVRYVWALPATAIGLAFALPAVCAGSRVRIVDGHLEVCGGALARLATASPFVAMTLGHVVLVRDETTAIACRAHEQVHVRQYERWGPLFLPLYAASSLWQTLNGRRFYWDNVFERQAREQTTARRSG